MELVFYISLAAVFAFFLLYWAAPSRRAFVTGNPTASVTLLSVTLCGLLLCYWSVSSSSDGHTFARHKNPFAIAVVFDLSPSMLAIPNPRFRDGVLPRYERGAGVVRDFLRGLEANGDEAYVAIIGFNREADVLMGWDSNPSQVREIIEYAVSPDILGGSGTSFEEAIKSLDRAFQMLPDDLQTNSRKLAIVVSDGEDTMRSSSFGYAEEMLASSNVDVVAVQTGLFDIGEGIPIYNSSGSFIDFRAVQGATYTIPNAAAMLALTNASQGRAAYFRAESPDTAERLLKFASGASVRDDGIDSSVLSTIGLISVLATMCAVIIR